MLWFKPQSRSVASEVGLVPGRFVHCWENSVITWNTGRPRTKCADTQHTLSERGAPQAAALTCGPRVGVIREENVSSREAAGKEGGRSCKALWCLVDGNCEGGLTQE